MVGIRGTANELDIEGGADWYRLPSARLPLDSLDPITGEAKCGVIGSGGGGDGIAGFAGGADAEVEGVDGGGDGGETGGGESADLEATAAGTTRDAGRGRRGAPRGGGRNPKKKFEAGRSWMRVTFPSAKDPTWNDRHPGSTACVVTVEADDDFVVDFDTKPKVFSIVQGGG